MSACRRGCQANLVALALYLSECQFRTVTPGCVLVKLPLGLGDRGYPGVYPGLAPPRACRTTLRGRAGGQAAGEAGGQEALVNGDPGPLRSFDPVAVGRLEAAAWVAYYRRQWLRLLVVSVTLVHRAFQLDWPRTLHGAWLVLRANQLWAPSSNDPDGARRCMRRFYALLRLAHGGPADPARAARLEVAWWAAHRERQHGAGHDAPGGAQPLITALARLYAYLYGVDEADVRQAARERAAAMDLSDEWVALGCPGDSPLIPAERAALVRSYAALLAAVHQTRP
jgi:hypothetical protein